MQKPYSAPRDENFELLHVKFHPKIKKKVIADNIFDMPLTHSFMSSVTPIFIQYLKICYQMFARAPTLKKIFSNFFHPFRFEKNIYNFFSPPWL